MTSKLALILAMALGIVGAGMNYVYLDKKSRNVEMVEFVGIAKDVQAGELMAREHFKSVSIPKNLVGNLLEFAVPFSGGTLETVISNPAPRRFEKDTLLLDQDLDTPTEQLKLGEHERAWPIPIDTRVLIPSLIEPGDQVWFLAAATPSVYPATGDENAPFEAEEPGESAPGLLPGVSPAGASPRIIGPFTVLALGNRLSSAELMRKGNVRQVQENVMLVRVTVDRSGNLDAPAGELISLLEETGSRPLGYLWRPHDGERK